MPELLAERLPLLSAEGRRAAQRVLDALNSAPALRAAQPTASPWDLARTRSGCGWAARHAWMPPPAPTSTCLWSCLDRLARRRTGPAGPSSRCGPRQADRPARPAAGSDCGVQLMTIHKSKGLEFEVVIVPDLQAGGGRGKGKLLSWLERGLAQPDDSGEITEFLIAPLQPKGADRGKPRSGSIASIVSASRRRTGAFSTSPPPAPAKSCTSSPALPTRLRARQPQPSEPSGSLLPPPGRRLKRRCAPLRRMEGRQSGLGNRRRIGVLESIAASAKAILLVMPPTPKPTLLRRLPPDYQPGYSKSTSRTSTGRPILSSLPAERVGVHEPQLRALSLQPFCEIPGAPGLASETWESEKSTTLRPPRRRPAFPRIGPAVHALFEELARLRMTTDWQACRLPLSERLNPASPPRSVPQA
jgi:hypothetical protein